MGLLFNKNEVTSLEDLKEKNEEMYNSLLEEARGSDNQGIDKLKAELAEAKQALADKEEVEKISQYAEKLEVEAPKEKMSFSDALLMMVDASVEKRQSVQDSFEKTASNDAGSAPDNGDEDAPKTLVEAMNMIADRDGITKTEAMEKVKIEFKELF